MFHFLTIDLARAAYSTLRKEAVAERLVRRPKRRSGEVKTWIVFAACLFFSGVGVAVSFLVFSTTMRSYRLWGAGFVIAMFMLGLNYAAKYANRQARLQFTPLDLLQYLCQGFLWPTTWPALARLFGIPPLSPPL